MTRKIIQGLGLAAVTTAAVVMVGAAPASASSAPIPKAVQASKGWVDFNGDGRADFCRVSDYNYLKCTVSTGTGFGTTYSSASAVDPGYGAGRAWADVTGDGKADYCRVVGVTDKYLNCTPSTATGFGPTFGSGPVQAGYDAGRAWADATGDGRVDYCRVVDDWGPVLRCTPSTGTGFGSTFGSRGIDPGYDAGRAWTDVTGDGKADYCRVTGGWDKFVHCTPSTGSGFGATFGSGKLDPGYDSTRAWADVNKDGRADFCRGVGTNNRIVCTLSNGSSFGSDISKYLDVGYDAGRGWADHNGDGTADFCRAVGPWWDLRLRYDLAYGSGFSTTYTSAVVDPGYDDTRRWADFNGDGRADYCRMVGGAYKNLQCTVSTGSGFGTTYTSGVIYP